MNASPTIQFLRSLVSRMGYYCVKLYRGQDIERVKGSCGIAELLKSLEDGEHVHRPPIIVRHSAALAGAYTFAPH